MYNKLKHWSTDHRVLEVIIFFFLTYLHFYDFCTCGWSTECVLGREEVRQLAFLFLAVSVRQNNAGSTRRQAADFKMTTNHRQVEIGDRKWGQCEVTAAASSLSAPVMTVSEVDQTTFEPDGGTSSSTALHRDWLYSWQQPGGKDAQQCTEAGRTPLTFLCVQIWCVHIPNDKERH